MFFEHDHRHPAPSYPTKSQILEEKAERQNGREMPFIMK